MSKYTKKIEINYHAGAQFKVAVYSKEDEEKVYKISPHNALDALSSEEREEFLDRKFREKTSQG